MHFSCHILSINVLSQIQILHLSLTFPNLNFLSIILLTNIIMLRCLNYCFAVLF
jgi:hypothetical protein